MKVGFLEQNFSYFLTYLGLLPFFALLLMILTYPVNSNLYTYSLSMFKSYGLLIATFLAGSHWGINLNSDVNLHLPFLSNLILIFIWLSYTFLSSFYFIISLLFVFNILLLIDKKLLLESIISYAYFWLRARVTCFVNLVLLTLTVTLW